MSNHIPKSLWIAVLGVVYGDIGTSPLYALKGCPQHDVVGLISVFLWTIFLIVTLKYVSHILKIDNKGEGGILALVALTKKLSWGVIGLALFMGDSILTPAISILGALEGLDVAISSITMASWVPGFGALLLLLLFGLQRLGTHHVGQLFGPIMVVWFAVLMGLGLPAIYAHPQILKAFNPWEALNFLCHGSTPVLGVLGHALLAVTGAEALYADLGHFGRKPIERAWLWFVWPALMINYLGQGAALLGGFTGNPFYALAPVNFILPLVLLATVASLIASQAVISGVFSLVWQGMMLGYFPRMKVVHTSIHHVGQIYIPAINTLMMLGALLAVGLFQSSENLANAYGLSVASLMWLTTIVALTMRPLKVWHGALMVVGIWEAALVVSSLSKFWHGAWYAFLMTGLAYFAIKLWSSNHRLLYRGLARKHVAHIVERAAEQPRIPGVGVFVQKISQDDAYHAPLSLVLHEHYYAWMPEIVVCVNVVISNDMAKTKVEDRYQAQVVGENFFVVDAVYGFKETPDLNRVIAWVREQGLMPEDEEHQPYFYWGRVMPIASDHVKLLNGVKEKLFVLLARLQVSQHELIRTPYARTLELTTHATV